jgi:hypothetical protein
MAALTASPAYAGEAAARLFEKAVVRVGVTEGDEELADLLLEGARTKRRERVPLATLQPGEGATVLVRLINRQWLSPDPEIAEDELLIAVEKAGRRETQVTLSAPDAALLRQAVLEFRSLRELPRSPVRRKVRSLAVVPVGVSARAVQHLVERRAVVMPVADWEKARLAHADELLLIDRSAPLPASLREAVEKHPMRRGDTIAWKFEKPGGGVRAYVCGPASAAVEQAVKRGVDLERLSESPTVLHSARDLTGVRRIAVSGLGRDPLAQRVADSLAGRTASGLRSLDAFEVLEREGLKNILAELALGQAGITRGADRVRLQKLAAADALLIVDVAESRGNTEFSGRAERLTPKLGPAPRRPLEPSRYRLPVDTDHPKTRGLLEALAGRGNLKYEDEWRDEMYLYETRTLPAYHARLRDWEQQRRTRPVQWRIDSGLRGSLTLRGSMRLVDLADGLVLWEAPFETTERGDQPGGRRTITTIGEDSVPGDRRGSGSEGAIPEFLLSGAVEAVLEQAIGALRGGAILPTTLPVAESVRAQPIGKVLDVDGEQLLIGLGASEGVFVGDVLRVRLESGEWLRLTVTRVRPRTCDAVLADGEDRTLRGRLSAGLGVERAR